MYRLATHFANLVCTPLNNITKRRQTILKMAVSVDAMLTMRNGDIGFGITSTKRFCLPCKSAAQRNSV